jgi:hypothetical protein
LQVLLLGSATAEAQRIQGLLSAIDSALECSLAKTAAALSDRV